MQSILATVSVSEEIEDTIYLVFMLAFLLSILFCLVALILRVFFTNKTSVLRAASVAAMAFSIGPIAFAWYVYKIDYVPAEIDGTRASGPLWKQLAQPIAPLLLAMGVYFSSLKMGKNPPKADS
jgi:hypothetical protein